MQNNNLSKYLPLVLVLITLVFGISYFHESEVTEVRQDVSSGLAAPARESASEEVDYKSEIPL